MINKHYREVKKVLKKERQLDTYFVSKFGFSPYMACEHGCKYCDGRAEKYYVEGDFEKDIIIRKNIAELLDIELGKQRDFGVVIIGSGISDSYQPCELQEELMRDCLKVLIKHKFPCLILTKSVNLLRDIDLLEELNNIAGVTVASSLTFADDKDRAIIEPGASSIEERCKMIRECQKRGISTGIMAMPITPYIVDNEIDLPRLFDLYASLNPDFVMIGSMTLRVGKNKDIFLEMIKNNYPHLLEKFQDLYSNNLQSGSPQWQYSHPFYSKAETLMKERGFSPVVPLKSYIKRFPLYDVLYIYLKHLKVLYKNYKEDINRLKVSYNSYKEWYIPFTGRLSRSRKMTYHDLEEEFEMLVISGYIEGLIDNKRLYDNIRKNVLGDL
ncbi:MAG: hypothetical protein B6226_02605 [Candidatus Cloacimonetes bacterium 4572_65]|nr:MAG: hypothetical protein B6226_02605 [Candidatus Cloacimonetes bacterium 4572_65]